MGLPESAGTRQIMWGSVQSSQKPSTKITPTSWLSYSSLGNSIILFLAKSECMLLNITLFKAFGAGGASTSVECIEWAERVGLPVPIES